VRICLVIAITLALGLSEATSQERCCYEKPQPEISIKSITAKSRIVFVGTLVDAEPLKFKSTSRKSYRLVTTSRIKFSVESFLKGQKIDTIEAKGNNLALLYDEKKFLVFLYEEKDGFWFDSPYGVLPIINVISPNYHWEIGVHGGKRLPGEYEPYVFRGDANSSLWMAGDTARWTLSLKRDVMKELVILDPQFADPRKAEEVFSLTTLGCQWIKDEWDRMGGVGYIGWRPCPLPLAFVQAYVRVLVRMEGK
ncbi:MAG: hypothetical protein ABL899_02465, partial [Nitrospira sp.]